MASENLNRLKIAEARRKGLAASVAQELRVNVCVIPTTRVSR
jgi:hypothetical protein